MRCAPRASNGPNHLGLRALQTLRYASRAKSIQNVAVVNEVISQHMPSFNSSPALLSETKARRRSGVLGAAEQDSFCCLSLPFAGFPRWNVRLWLAQSVSQPQDPNEKLITSLRNEVETLRAQLASAAALAAASSGPVRGPTTWTILQKDGPSHLGLWYNALPEHQMARITSGCAPCRCRR